MVGLSNNYMIDLPLGGISLLKVTKFCKVSKMFKNWAKLHRKFDPKKDIYINVEESILICGKVREEMNEVCGIPKTNETIGSVRKQLKASSNRLKATLANKLERLI
jgi:hypothetical protein